MRRTFAFLPILISIAFAACGGNGNTTSSTSTSSSSSSTGSGGMGGTIDPGEFAAVPSSCAFQCPAVNPSQIGTKSPTLSQVDFNAPESLNQGIVSSPPDRVYVASAQGVVQAITIDTATGTLTRDDARSVTLPPSSSLPGTTKFYSSGVAVSADNTRLFVSGVK